MNRNISAGSIHNIFDTLVLKLTSEEIHNFHRKVHMVEVLLGKDHHHLLAGR
uniref:Uncharacterized protein n=1 Tax=Arion vulgaris TaxID=1028688 RepID=A0A0B7BVR6_9EUPU